MKTVVLKLGFLYQQTGTLLLKTCAAGKISFTIFVLGRQDNKVVGTDIQMGPFVWVNKECSLHDRPVLTLPPLL